MLLIVCLLLTLGVTVIYTSDSSLALQQGLFALLGIGGYLAVRFFDYRDLKTFIKPLYFLVLFFLVVVFILGVETRGSTRWIPLGFFNFQPSELAKLAMILSLAYFWSTHTANWKNIAKSLLILLPVVMLIFRQPDLGTALTVAFIWCGMLLAANISFLKLATLTLAGLVSAPLTWLVLRDYQKERLISFFSPSHDPLGIGYNVIQSTIAVGSGLLFGRGLGRGTQSRLQFLPEFRTDFIFAFIAEELGLMGGVMVLVLYLLLFILAYKVLIKLKDKFGELIIVGVLSMLFFQIVVNIGMNIGILPVTGITLPLLSYGGSSIITTLLAIGLIDSIHRFGLSSNKYAEIS